MSATVSNVIKQVILASIALAVIILSAAILFGQESSRPSSFCSNNDYWSSGVRAYSRDLREMNIDPTGTLTVDAGQNGGVKVIGEERSDVLIRACVQAWGGNEAEAQERTKRVKIETDGVIRGTAEDKKFSVSFEIFVPLNMDLDLKARNGGLSVRNVSGKITLNTENGGIAVADAGGKIKGTTENGGVSIVLNGTQWNGEGVDLETSNGGVSVTMSQHYSANLEIQTVNGHLKSTLPGMTAVKNSRTTGQTVNAAVNGGGAPIKVRTVNGGLVVKER